MLLVGKRISTSPVHVCKVYLIDEEHMDIRLLSPSRSQSVHRFSEGFSWSYPGNGPFQLALALLLETTNDDELSLALCPSFLEEVIAEITTTCWVLDTHDILEWIDQHKGK